MAGHSATVTALWQNPDYRARMIASMQNRKRKHGHRTKTTTSPTWSSWRAMVKCCACPTTIDWARYGGRGITVDPRWLDFRNFLEDMGERPAGKTLDRIDNGAGYSQVNCRWATYSEQARNRNQRRRAA